MMARLTFPARFVDLQRVFALQRRRVAQRLHAVEKRVVRLRRTGRARKSWSMDV